MTTCTPHGLRRAITSLAVLTLSGACFGLSPQAHAQAPAVGNFPEFGLNTGNVAGSFGYPSAAKLTNGKFVVVTGVAGKPRLDSGTYFRIYSPQGAALGSFTRVKPMLMQDTRPSVAPAGAGFVVVINYQAHFDGPAELRGQRYSQGGVRVGAEFKINQTNPGHITEQKVTGLANGGFMVVWNAGPNASNSGEIYARRYTAAGVAVGGEFIVNTTRLRTQGFPAVAVLANGVVVVVWNTPGAGGYDDIHGQRYAPNGNRLGGEFKITSAVRKSETAPVITGLDGGGFVVAWTGGSAVVYGRRFNAAGVPSGPEFMVGERNYGHWEPIALSALSDNRFLIAWGDGQWGEHIIARVYGPTAASDSDEFQVDNVAAPESTNHLRPSAVALTGSKLFLMWSRYPPRKGAQVRLRRLDIPGR